MKKILVVFCLLVTGISGVFSSPLRKQIEVLLQDSATGGASVAFVYFTEGTSTNYLPAEDVAVTINPGDTVPQLYSFTQDNVACGTNSYGTFDNTTVVPLGAGIYTSGTYTFSILQFTNFDQASMLFLEDRLLGVTTDLRQTAYRVRLNTTGQITNRFFLHITYPPVVNTIAAGCTNHDGIITISEDNSVTWNACKIYDSTSALIAIDTNVTGNFSFTGLHGGNYRVEFDYSIYAPIQYVLVEEHQLISGMNVSSNHDTVMQNIQFYSEGSNANEFLWDFGDGSTITGIANPTYQYLYPGTYIATVNCSNAYGCTGHADTVMYIDEATAIDAIDGNTVKIITDSKSVRIELSNAVIDDYSYNVYNIQGQLIKTGRINSTVELIDFSNETAGVYVVCIRSASSSLSQKVLITH